MGTEGVKWIIRDFLNFFAKNDAKSFGKSFLSFKNATKLSAKKETKIQVCKTMEHALKLVIF